MSMYAGSRRRSSEGAGLAFFVFLVVAVPLYIWNGFVLKTIWNWFVPSIFQGVPTLGIAQAIGLGLVVSIFTYRPATASDREGTVLERVLADIFSVVLTGAIVLLVGFIVHGLI